MLCHEEEDAVRSMVMRLRRGVRPCEKEKEMEAVEMCVRVAERNESLRWEAMEVLASMKGCSESQFGRLLQCLRDTPLVHLMKQLARCSNGITKRNIDLINIAIKCGREELIVAAIEECLLENIGKPFLAALICEARWTALPWNASKSLVHGFKLICAELGFLLKPDNCVDWWSIWVDNGLEGVSCSNFSLRLFACIFSVNSRTLSVCFAEMVFAVCALCWPSLSEVDKVGSMRELVPLLQTILVDEECEEERGRWVWPLLCLLREMECTTKISVMQHIPPCRNLPLHVQGWSRVAQIFSTGGGIDSVKVTDLAHRVSNETTWFPGSESDARTLAQVAFRAKYFILCGVLELKYTKSILLQPSEVVQLVDSKSTNCYDKVGQLLSLLATISMKGGLRDYHLDLNPSNCRTPSERAALLYLDGVNQDGQLRIHSQEVFQVALRAKSQLERKSAMFAAFHGRHWNVSFSYLLLCWSIQGTSKLLDLDNFEVQLCVNSKSHSMWLDFFQRLQESSTYCRTAKSQFFTVDSKNEIILLHASKMKNL